MNYVPISYPVHCTMDITSTNEIIQTSFNTLLMPFIKENTDLKLKISELESKLKEKNKCQENDECDREAYICRCCSQQKVVDTEQETCRTIKKFIGEFLGDSDSDEEC